MGDLPTVRVRNPSGDGTMIINRDEYDAKKHGKIIEEFPKGGEDVQNPGVGGSGDPNDPLRNPSGTYSEPTPTDIRYPDKRTTEFENNVGAFIGKSAAGLREELDIPDKPGGIHPYRDIEVPENWRELSPRERKELAKKLGAPPDLTTAQANERIEQTLEERAAEEAEAEAEADTEGTDDKTVGTKRKKAKGKGSKAR